MRDRGRRLDQPPDRTVLLLLALYACWGSAIPAMKLMVETVPPVGGAALVFLLAGVVLAGVARGRPRPRRAQPTATAHPLEVPHLGRLRRQNVAIGLTGLPDVPAKRTGATARWKSHWPSSAAVVAHTSRSQLSSSHRPIATRLTA